MNREDIIRMAREVGFVDYELDDGTTESFDKRYERFFQAAYAAGAAAEREACAKVCDEMKPSEATFDRRFFIACTLNANAIRARSNND